MLAGRHSWSITPYLGRLKVCTTTQVLPPGQVLSQCCFAACSVLYRFFQGDRTRAAASISIRLVASSNLAVQDPESATEHFERILVLQDADWGFEGPENAIRCSWGRCTSGQCPKSAVAAGYAADIVDPCIHELLIVIESV